MLKYSATCVLMLSISLGSRAQEIPVNDECENAIGPLKIDGELLPSSTVGATTVPNFISIYQCAGQSFDLDTPGVWFQALGTGARLRASTCFETTNVTKRITLYDGESCDQKSCMDSGYDADPTCPFENSTHLEWDSKVGEQYFIFVHELASDSWGEFGLSISDVSESPDNDSCDNALELEDDSTSQGTTIGATISDGVKCSKCVDGGPKNPGVWFRIPAESNETDVIVATCGPLLTFNVSIFHGDACGEFFCQASTLMDLECEDGYGFQTTFLATSGRDYYLYVHAAEAEGSLDSGIFAIAFTRSDVVDIDGKLQEDLSGSSRIGLVVGYLFLSLLLLIT